VPAVGEEVLGMLSLESLKLGVEHVEMKQKDTGRGY